MKLNVLKFYLKANKPLIASLAILAMLATIFSQFVFPLQLNACSKPQPPCPSSPEYSISKTVRNMSAGQSNYSEIVNAEIGERVIFKIVVTNTGETTLEGLEVSDDLPGELSYINGSLWTDASVGASSADFFGPGLALGNLIPGRSVTLTFDADVIAGANSTLTNVIVAWGKEAEEKSDSAMVFVLTPVQNLNLSINKTVRNLTSGQGSYTESTEAVNNDQVEFQIEIGNTGDAALNNVFVRDVLPSFISYISGSTRVNNQTVSDGIVSGGINIGSIAKGGSATINFKTAVNYSGIDDQFLTNTAFARADQVNEKSDTATVKISDPNLSISKTVRNITSGQSYFSESINAQSNDRLAFQIQIQNTGVVTLSNVFVRDNLPFGLSFSSGSTRVDGSSVSDGIVSGGINVGSLNVGAIRTITFETTVNSGFNNQTLTNTGFARADQVSEKSDTATVFVSGISDNFNFTITKSVRNQTAGQVSYFDAINANNGDQLMFQIQIQNTGNDTLNNVFVRDVLPSGLNYISGSSRVDGSFISDGIVSGGINTGSLVVNGIRTITFETSINIFGSYGSQTLTNTAYARADQVSEKSDTATAYVSQQNIYGNLNIVKYVRNQTAGQSSLTSSTNANSGDRLTFTIQISTLNISQLVSNVRVWDSLPTGLTFVSGTARLDGIFVSDALVSSGINLGTLVGNQTRTIAFDATVNSGLSNQTLTNVAYVSGDNVPQQSASAQVIISQVTPLYPSATLTKRVANLTSPNGTDTDNNASVGNTLQYTITLTNNGPGTLNNISINDVLPPYTIFQSADSGVYNYNSSNNQISWQLGSLANGTNRSFSYQVKVQTVPYNGYVIANTAQASASNLGIINSNEVRTTVGGVIKGEVIKVVTGGDSLPRNLAIAGMISLWSIFILYLLMEYGNFWRGARLKLAILKLRLKKII